MRKSLGWIAIVVLTGALVGCDSDSPTDAGGGDTDAGPAGTDAGPGDTDAGPGGMDAGPGDTDAGPENDAGMEDAGMEDAGMEDAGMMDAGMPDAGRPDAGRPDAGAPDAGPGSGGCVMNSECAATHYCMTAGPMMCGATGTCAPRPMFCTGLFAPVCGCDNNTYSNSCVAASAGQNVDMPGMCP